MLEQKQISSSVLSAADSDPSRLLYSAGQKFSAHLSACPFSFCSRASCSG